MSGPSPVIGTPRALISPRQAARVASAALGLHSETLYGLLRGPQSPLTVLHLTGSQRGYVSREALDAWIDSVKSKARGQASDPFADLTGGQAC